MKKSNLFTVWDLFSLKFSIKKKEKSDAGRRWTRHRLADVETDWAAERYATTVQNLNQNGFPWPNPTVHTLNLRPTPVEDLSNTYWLFPSKPPNHTQPRFKIGVVLF